MTVLFFCLRVFSCPTELNIIIPLQSQKSIKNAEIRRGEAVIGAVIWFCLQKMNKNGKKALVLRD